MLCSNQTDRIMRQPSSFALPFPCAESQAGCQLSPHILRKNLSFFLFPPRCCQNRQIAGWKSSIFCQNQIQIFPGKPQRFLVLMHKQISVGNAGRESRWSSGLECSAVLALCWGCAAEGLRGGAGWLNPGAKFGLLSVYSEHSGVNSRALLACTSSLAWAAHPTESAASSEIPSLLSRSCFTPATLRAQGTI